MTKSTIARTTCSSAPEAGVELGQQIAAGFNGESPDAAILFVSPQYEFAPLLRGFDEQCR